MAEVSREFELNSLDIRVKVGLMAQIGRFIISCKTIDDMMMLTTKMAKFSNSLDTQT